MTLFRGCAVLATTFTVLEYILSDLVIGWSLLFDWVPGPLLNQVSPHWLGNPDTTLYMMRNLLLLEEDPQGLVVVMFRMLWLSAVVCPLTSRMGHGDQLL